MPFLPFSRTSISTDLSLDDLKIHLVALCASGARFQGEVVGDRLKGFRAITYPNSFLPVVEGRLKPVRRGSRLDVTMRLSALTAIFMGFWLAYFVRRAILAYAAHAVGAPFSGTLQGSLGAAAFGYALTMAGFWFESRATRRMLSEYLKEVPTQARASLELAT